jgi:rhomboid family protein
LVYWFVLQFISGVTSLSMAASGGVAWWAHVGGFLTGMLITALARRR